MNKNNKGRLGYSGKNTLEGAKTGEATVHWKEQKVSCVCGGGKGGLWFCVQEEPQMGRHGS